MYYVFYNYVDRILTFLTTYLPRVDIYAGMPLLLYKVKYAYRLHFLYHLPNLISVVCERPPKFTKGLFGWIFGNLFMVVFKV